VGRGPTGIHDPLTASWVNADRPLVTGWWIIFWHRVRALAQANGRRFEGMQTNSLFTSKGDHRIKLRRAASG
jgi:hypothetical protein